MLEGKVKECIECQLNRKKIHLQHGLLELLVTDNDSVFTSAEFGEFMNKNGIRHITSAPYHPASNGLAIQILKEGVPGYTQDIPRAYTSTGTFDATSG